MGLFRRKKSEPIRTAHIEDDSYAFRRSRTLTGSLSNSVQTVREDRAALKSDRVKQHDLRRHRRKIGFLLFACLLAAAIIYLLVSQFIGSVTIASKSALSVEKQQAYAAAINKYLSTSPGERFSFSLQKDRLLADLQSQHAEVEFISLSRFGVGQASIADIKIRVPVISWDLRGKTYYIDSHGVAFQTLIGEAPTLRVEDNTGITLEDSATLASDKMLRFIGRIIALLQQSGQTVERLELPADTSRQINVYLQGRDYPFYTSIDRDPAGQATDVINALNYVSSQQISPQYVDVRVGSRAYYR